jgi:RHS repeat-associated protein
MNPLRYTGRELDSETNLYYYRARYYDSQLGRFISEDPIGFVAGINFYRYAHNDAVGLYDPFGLRDCNEKETLAILQKAYADATAGFFKGPGNIRRHSQGGGDFDFAHNEHAGDTFARCGVRMSAGDFGNYIAGFQSGAWDDAFYGDREIGYSLKHTWRLRYAEGLANLAGIYYHLRGDTDVKGDPWDKVGRPWVTLGADSADGNSVLTK